MGLLGSNPIFAGSTVFAAVAVVVVGAAAAGVADAAPAVGDCTGTATAGFNTGAGALTSYPRVGGEFG